MREMKRIDLNGDVGESFGAYKMGQDEELIPLISSANIACGFHAGDPGTMRYTIGLACKHKVAPGAHPGFPDLLGFGRRTMDVTPEEVKDYLTYQIGALQVFAKQADMTLQHVKAHGALYHMAAENKKVLGALVEAVASLDNNLILVTQADASRGEVQEIGDYFGIRMAFEFFADRAYHGNGLLVSRREPGALLVDPEIVTGRVMKMIKEGRVTAKEGQDIELQAETICLHGDNPKAVELARGIRAALKSEGIEVVPLGEIY